MARDIDYASVAIPDDTPAEDYTFAERRAEILELIRRAGHPRAINQSRLADRYGCSQPNISNDLDVLEEWLAENLTDRRHLNLNTVKERVLRGLLDAGESGSWQAFEAAWRVAKDYEEWLTQRTDLDELSERFDVIEERQERAKYR